MRRPVVTAPTTGGAQKNAHMAHKKKTSMHEGQEGVEGEGESLAVMSWS